jgi:hypothetical protein
MIQTGNQVKNKKMIGGLTVALFAIFMSNCSTQFNPEAIKGKLAEPLDQAQALKIKSLPDNPITVLSPKEQDELSDIVFNHLHDKFDHLKIAQMACHYKGLHASDKCENTRRKCLSYVAGLTVENIQQKLKADEPKIKGFVKQQTATPSSFESAFKVFAEGMDIAIKLDCSSSDEQREAVNNQFHQDLVSKYSNNAGEIIKLIDELLVYIFTF